MGFASVFGRCAQLICCLAATEPRNTRRGRSAHIPTNVSRLPMDTFCQVISPCWCTPSNQHAQAVEHAHVISIYTTRRNLPGLDMSVASVLPCHSRGAILHTQSQMMSAWLIQQHSPCGCDQHRTGVIHAQLHLHACMHDVNAHSAFYK